MSAPATTPPAASVPLAPAPAAAPSPGPDSNDDAGPPLPHTGLTVAVLGARDCGARELAAHLRAHTGAYVIEDLGATAGEDGATGETRVDVVLVAVDLICPIRPDDMEAILLLARRFPLAAVLTRAERYPTYAQAAQVIARQLAEHDVAAPLLWRREDDDIRDGPGGDAAAGGPDAAFGAALLSGARERARRGGRGTSGVIPGARSERESTQGGHEVQATLDWLQRARTESVTARSAVLRQQSHSARVGLQALVSRHLRELAAEAKTTLAAAGRGELEGAIEQIDEEAAELSRRLSGHARAEAAHLRRRHLGSTGDGEHHAPARLRLRFGRPPAHRGEEAVMLLMGSAGGAGLGRLIATPFGDSPVALAIIIPLALAAGAALGALGVRARRVTALRSHLIGLAVEHFAALRTEIDLVVSEQLLHAEAAITDAFAYDGGPRVREIEQRIAALRQTIHGASHQSVGQGRS